MAGPVLHTADSDPDPLLGQEALIGQYAHGNEPSHHVTWLYCVDGRTREGSGCVSRSSMIFIPPGRTASWATTMWVR
jgi:desulfoferrodoxin (superoxide reductase-like protein)